MGLFDNFKNTINSRSNKEDINTSLLNNSDYYSRKSSPVPINSTNIRNTPVQQTQPIQQTQQTQPTQPDKISADVAEFNKKVQKLQVLKKQGILDDREYEEARQKLMKQVTGLL